MIESGGMEPDDATQSIAAGEITGNPYGPLESTRNRAFGGTAHAWGTDFGEWTEHHGQFRHLDHADFEHRAWVPHSGWPFGLDELRPYYDRASEICATGTSIYSVGDKEIDTRANLSLDPERLQNTIFRFGPGARFTEYYRNTLETDPELRVYYHATVTNIETNDAGSRVTTLLARTPGGSTWKIHAGIIVLACGGIENARFLLTAESGRGIGNDHDLVGRFFMEHPTGTTGVYAPASQDIEAIMEPYALHTDHQGLLSRWYLAIADQLVQEEKILRYAVCLWPTEPEPDWMPDDLIALASRQRAKFHDDEAPQFYALSFMSEQAPNPSSRVTLSDRTACR
jgi:choline dehydrogenase-like flavoprotein